MTGGRTIQELCAENPATVPLWKRSFDVVLASVALLASLPLTLLIALLVKLTSAGPVFFCQERYGLNGKLFRIIKFRKMADTVRGGDRVTARHDFRMTGLGRLLERTKLDELPQLINILKGEMSFVGPRPEDPAFADLHPEAFAVILGTPPGVAGPNQIVYRNESELYPPDCKDRGAYYADHILGLKIPVDVDYARNRSLFWDIVILLATIGVTVLGVLPMASLRRNPVLFAHLVAAPLIATISLTAALALGAPLALGHEDLDVIALAIVALHTIFFFLFGLHAIVPRYLGVRDTGAVLKTAMSAAIAGGLATSLFGDGTPIWLAMLVYASFSILLTLFWLHLLRQWAERRHREASRLAEIGIAGGFGFVSIAAWVAAGWIVTGIGSHVPTMTIGMASALVIANATVFYALAGPRMLLRPHATHDQFAIVGVAALAGIAFHCGRLILVELPLSAGFVTVEFLLRTTLVIILQWAASTCISLHRRESRTLLVGTLREVNEYLARLLPTYNANWPAGIVLVGEFRQGMTIHAVPILGEVSETHTIREQLDFERVVALAQEHRKALMELGIEAELQAPNNSG